MNDGTDPLVVTATAEGPFSVASKQPVVVPAGSSAPLALAAQAAAANAVPGETTSGVLHVTTNDPFAPKFDVALKLTTRGASLHAMPAYLDLGWVPTTMTSGPHEFTITNTGNADVALALAPVENTDFHVVLDGGAAAPGGFVAGSAAFFASAPGASQTVATLTAQGAVCGALPSITIAANGTEGTFGVSPGQLDFGEVPCGKTAAPKTLTLLDGGDAPYAFHASFTPGAAFQVSPASGIVNQSLVLKITPLSLPQVASTSYDAFGAKLLITTNIPDDPPHAIPIRETAYGAVLRFATPSYSFGKVQVGQDATGYEQVVNDGNAAAQILAASAGAFSMPATTIASWGGGVAITFHPDPTQLGTTESATLAPAVAGFSCGGPLTLDVDATNHDVANRVLALDDATCVSTGGNTASCRAYCWGNNADGQLGTNAVSGATTPHYVAHPPGQLDQCLVSGGGALVMLGVPAGDAFFRWGTIDGTTSAPTYSGYLGYTVEMVGASDLVACYSDYAGAYCFGKGGYLGDGTSNDSASPVQATKNWSYPLDTGYDGHTCVGIYVSSTEQELQCWGPDDWGQLGDGNSGSSQLVLSPVVAQAVAPTFDGLAAGDRFTCAHDPASGDAMCWGRNTSGECATTPSSSPVLTPTSTYLGQVRSFDAGRDFVCASRGTDVTCWGSNTVGQLGDGGNEAFSATPVTVLGLGVTYQVSAGGRHACALLSDLRVACWGSNTNGELGNGTTVDARSPVFVAGFD